MTAPTPGPLITSISVRELFGKRSYDVVVPEIDGLPTRLLLLHGDNGSGKTTLLRLVWHALSAADNQGHRSFIARTPFSQLSIRMRGGREIRIKKTDGLVGSFSLELIRSGFEDLLANYEASEDLSVRSPSRYANPLLREEFLRGQRLMAGYAVSSEDLKSIRIDMTLLEGSIKAEQEYLEFLANEVKTPLYLADDRSLYSDDPDINRMRESLSRREDSDRRDRLARLVFIELQVTIRRVNEHLRSITLGGQNDGSANSNAIYMNVLRQLVNTSSRSVTAEDSPSSVSELLEQISSVSPAYEQFGLVPKFDIDEFRRLIDRAQSPELASLAERVVSPFLSSLRARYDALEEAHDLLVSLIPTVNGFLAEKELRFTPRGGLRIFTTGDDLLEVEALSSGERQLLMLLCTTLLARVDTNLFIIDEPELSLGVEWQRKILDSLMALTDKTNLQFLVATHSVEIISARPESLVQLRPL